MRDLTADTLERIRLLHVEIQECQQQQERARQRLEAMEVLLEWERDRMGTSADQSQITPNANGRWAGISISQAVVQLMNEHPEWRELSGGEQVRNIYETLVREGFAFEFGKMPKGSINMSLLRMRNAERQNGKMEEAHTG